MADETTATTVSLSAFTDGMAAIMRECFETIDGPASMFLDRGDSFVPTLDAITADEASRPVGSSCASIAAQVNHTRYYIDQVISYLSTGQFPTSDWPGSWDVGPVDEAAWDELKAGLMASYRTLMRRVKDPAAWTDPESLTGGMGLIAHCAYHLGQIREALCTVQDRRAP